MWTAPHWTVLAVVIAVPCACGPRGGPDAGPDGDADGDADSGVGGDADLDTDAILDDGDMADGDIGPGFSGVIESTDGTSGAVVIELTPVQDTCAAPLRFDVETGRFRLPDVPDGTYGVLAWLDTDGDGSWDGIWESGGEPSARMGVTLPRHGFRLVLRRGVPEPVLEANPEWVELYFRAWELAEGHIAAGTPENGFADHYMDEAFSEQIFQWDTCFMTLFGRFGLDAFPVMASLDNFYGVQRDDGFICRVVNEWDGGACDPGEDPNIIPPLFAWVELLHARQSGDLSRIPCVIPVLRRYHDWIDDNVRTGPGLYYTSMLGSGMDNAPRDAAYDGWVDITAQQALGRRSLARLADLVGDSEVAADAEAERICADVRSLMWNDDEGFFFDLGWGGAFLPDMTLAGVWPLVAGCATQEQAARVASHLRDPAEFWRSHVFASAAADSAGYDPAGHYWRGGVWAPTNYAAMTALDTYGRDDLARRATENHLWNLDRVSRRFVPDPAQLAPDARGDGRDTLWELYAPDAASPGTRWDATYLGRQDFVGWTGLGPIALLIEQVVGLDADAPADRLRWRLTRTDRHGVLGFRFGDQLVDLVARARDDFLSPVVIDVDASDAFTLDVVVGERTWTFAVPAGESTVELDPAEAVMAADTVPAGPHGGHAVLGNGRVSAVVSDDPAGPAAGAGMIHLYWRDFGLDLVEEARPVVVRDGREAEVGQVGLDPFFAAYARTDLDGAGSVVWRSFVGADDAVVWEGSALTAGGEAEVRVVPFLRLRGEPDIDLAVAVEEVSATGTALVATLSDGTSLVMGSRPAPLAMQAGEIDEAQVLGGLSGEVGEGLEMALELVLAPRPGEPAPFTWVVAAGDDRTTALEALERMLATDDLLAAARTHWDDWSPAVLCASDGARCRVAAANLYAARASSLGGQVPADLTGQFVTSGFPQLYPRDALMVARAFGLAGHADEAWEIVNDWLGSGRAGPSPGEWYARYDARGRAVDGGSGARYDVPEWDSNGYIAVLVEALGPDRLSAREREVVLRALDFLVDHQDGDGLFREGGIVEWPGRLPGTAMTSWAGLDAGARLARRWGDDERAAAYLAAAGRARGGLIRLFDSDRMLLADERDGVLMYDSSLLFGPVWGFPADPLLDRTHRWLLDHATGHGGGVRYFWGNDYGQDLFFFTTSAAAQVSVITGDLDTARDLVSWMLAQTTRYGLAPERVFLGGWGAAEASPLSWCAAEVAVTVLALREGEAHGGEPVVDGEVSAAEYRPLGPVAVDADGAPDMPRDPVALFAHRRGDDLFLGMLLAGEVETMTPDVRYDVYLSDSDGEGPVQVTAGGSRLTFRTSTTPGAVARITISPTTGTCRVGEHGLGGFADEPCADAVVGARALEVRVDLAGLGFSGPVQVIAVVSGGSAGEALLPRHGSLLTDGATGPTLVTFEVDASPVAGSLDPGRGVVVTLSGDRPELGAWRGHALALRDDGEGGDEAGGDGTWTTVVALPDRGRIEFKYLVGHADDSSWAGVEFDGANREAWVQDPDDTGRVRLRHVFGVRGGEVPDP